MGLYRQKVLQDYHRRQPQETRSTTSTSRILQRLYPKLTDLSSEETASLKSQVAELYKAQNANLQTIKSLEAGLTSLQQAEKQLKQEYLPISRQLTSGSLISALVGRILNSEPLSTVKLFARKTNKFR